MAAHRPRRVVILGGGTGGTAVANRLRRYAPMADLDITVIDQDDRHVYQPGLLFVPFGLATADELVRHRGRQLHAGIGYRVAGIDHVDLGADLVHLDGGADLPYDVLVVATGATLLPEETDGLTGPGWMQRVFTFYDLTGAAALAGALTSFDGGRLVVDVVDLPIKCPVAPLEFCFLADWYFHERGIRHKVDITYVTPLDGAFTRPVAAHALAGLLEEKGIELVTDFNVGSVDGEGGTLTSFDDRTVAFDVAVVVPVHGGSPYVERSPGLGDALGFVPVDQHTLQSTARPNVFAIGDAAGVPASKAGSVTHFEAEAVVANVGHHLAGEPLSARFDGHTNCFIETGFGKALLIDFNYETEPVPGRFPGAVGLPLLKESRLNHLGKRLFQTLYWHSLLPGRDLPLIHADMPITGKDVTAMAPKLRVQEADVPTTTLAGHTVETNDEGFFVDPSQWNPAMAEELADAEGIELLDEHWKVIELMRREYAAKGTGPTVRVLGRVSGIPIKRLYELFPKGPAKVAAKVAGIPKPRGCI